MQLINRFRATVALIAVFALVGAGMFALEAYAGPNCGARSARSAGTKSACTKTTTVQKASAVSKSYTKEECMAKLMAAGMTKADAEAKYAECSKYYNSKNTASLASAKSGCSYKTTASLASAKSGCSKSAGVTTASAKTGAKGCCASKTTASLASVKSGCSSKRGTTATASLASAKSWTCDKNACIAWCMKEKGMTRAEAEARWDKCQKGLAEGKSCHGESKVTAAVASNENSAPVITATASGGSK